MVEVIEEEKKPRFEVTKTLFRPKFLHLAHHIHDNLLKAPLLIGGFYNWHRVLSGEFALHAHRKGRLKEYDILFMGLSSPELQGMLITRIREEIGEDSSTLLAVCVDYAVEIWDGTFNMHALELELKKCDLVFTGEPAMRNQLEALTNMPIELIEHPTNVRVLKPLAKPLEERQNAVLCLIHRYNNDWIPSYITVKDMPEINNYAICLDGNPNNLIKKMPFFQNTRPGVEYEQWIGFLSQAKVVIDSYNNFHTYGRSAVDCACLKVPCIGTEMIHAQPILWPELTTKGNDVLGQRKILKRLVSDKDFYKQVTDYAFEKVDEFGYASSLSKFENMIKGYRDGSSRSGEYRKGNKVRVGG